MALAQLLKKNTEEDRPTYIVAHSHGGNVAVEAMVALGDYQNFGICCLATPFFHAKPRSMTALGKAPLIWGLSGIFISLSAICSALLGESSYRIPLTSFLIGLGAFLGLYLGSMIETLEELSGYYSGQTHSTVPGDLNLHIIRVSGDEASLVLGFGQILAWASNRLYGMVLRGFQFSLFVSPFKRPWFSVGAAIIFTVLVAVIYTIYPEDHLTLMGRAYKLFWPLRLASLAFAVLLIGSITRIYDRLLLGLTLVGVLISSPWFARLSAPKTTIHF